MGTNLYIKMNLVFGDGKKPHLLDISTLLYDFELLYDFSLLLYAEEYRDYQFSQYFWRRRGRPLKDEHRLRASKIIKESPLSVELILHIVFGTCGAVWLLFQAIEKIRNWKLNRMKLEFEVKKLQYEKKIRFPDEQNVRLEIENKLAEKACLNIFNSLLKRLNTNPINLKDVDLYPEEPYVSESLKSVITQSIKESLEQDTMTKALKCYNEAIAHEVSGHKKEARDAYKSFLQHVPTEYAIFIQHAEQKIKALEQEITKGFEEFRE